jgi:hypothetical protein
MSLQTRLSDLITVLGTDYKFFRNMITGSPSGDLSGLTTTDKSSVVAAINEVDAGGGGGGANLTVSRTATTVTVLSDSGTDATLQAADTDNAGVMTDAMFDKLAGIEALADVTDAGNVGSTIHGATAKTTPVGADEIAIIDTEASNVLKRMTTTNFAAFIQNLIVDAAPGTMDTLNEIAAALGDDPNFAATMTTALAGKQPLDTDLTAIAALTSAANKVPYSTGAGTWDLADFSAAGRALVDDADAAAQRTTLSVYSQTELGNPETDLAALYATAKS